MTKKWHKCEKCKNGTEGIYVKICSETGEPIEDYKMQYERLTKVYKDDRNFVKPNWRET
jgi:hypothetical protein